MSVVKVRAALETALCAMAGMMAITSSSVAAATVITTTLPHGLTTNDVVAIVGHTGSTPSIGGLYPVTVVGTNTFSIPVNVTVSGTGGGWTATAFENIAFKPPASSVPYQQVHILFATPDNIVYGSTHREVGYVQVKLMYPLQNGTSTINTRAELLRSTFYRGACVIASGSHQGGVFNYLIDDMGLIDTWDFIDEMKVIIDKTPEVAPGSVEGDRYAVPVKIRFFANIT